MPRSQVGIFLESMELQDSMDNVWSAVHSPRIRLIVRRFKPSICILKVILVRSWVQILAAAQSYGENHVNFTQFGAFSKLCGSSATCAIAGALLLVRSRLHTSVCLTYHSQSIDETCTI